MGSKSKELYGAKGRGDLLFFDPEDLTVVVDKEHPLWDERVDLPLDERLVESIMKRGVLKPAIVRRNGTTPKGDPIVEVVDGRRRVRAARVANHRLEEQGAGPEDLIRVPAVTRRDDGSELFGITIAANELALKDTPLVRAKKLKRYMDMGRGIEEAAVDFGTTVTTLKALLSLLDCHEVVQKAIEAGRIGVTHAKALSALPREEQPAALESLFVKVLDGKPEIPLAEQVEKIVGDRNKIRVRTQKTKKHLKKFRENLASSKSQDAELAIALIDWFLGKEDALNKFRAIKARAEGLDEEEAIA